MQSRVIGRAIVGHNGGRKLFSHGRVPLLPTLRNHFGTIMMGDQRVRIRIQEIEFTTVVVLDQLLESALQVEDANEVTRRTVRGLAKVAHSSLEIVETLTDLAMLQHIHLRRQTGRVVETSPPGAERRQQIALFVLHVEMEQTFVFQQAPHRLMHIPIQQCLLMGQEHLIQIMVHGFER